MPVSYTHLDVYKRQVVLDVHRDAIETESGSRYAPVCTVDGLSLIHI